MRESVKTERIQNKNLKKKEKRKEKRKFTKKKKKKYCIEKLKMKERKIKIR